MTNNRIIFFFFTQTTYLLLMLSGFCSVCNFSLVLSTEIFFIFVAYFYKGIHFELFSCNDFPTLSQQRTTIFISKQGLVSKACIENICFETIVGESKPVIQEMVAVWNKIFLETLLSTHKLQDIFKAKKFGLFF